MACNCDSVNLNDDVNSTDAMFALNDRRPCKEHDPCDCEPYSRQDRCDCDPYDREQREAAERSNGCEPKNRRCMCSENGAGARTCCDSDGCCAEYPCRCRDKYWPEFAHPRWMSCECLYSCDCD